MVINLEQKKVKTKLVRNHFDLRFILNYNRCIDFYKHPFFLSGYNCRSVHVFIMTGKSTSPGIVMCPIVVGLEKHASENPPPARRHDMREGKGTSPLWGEDFHDKNIFTSCACIFNYILLACGPNYLIVSYSVDLMQKLFLCMNFNSSCLRFKDTVYFSQVDVKFE